MRRFLFFIFLIYGSLHAQTIGETINYTVCDDTTITIPYSTLYELMITTIPDTNNPTPEVYVALSYEGFGVINNLTTQPQFQQICVNGPFSRYYEVAVNSNEEIYLAVTGGGIVLADPNTCSYTQVGSLPFSQGIAMSFDTADNLYASDFNSTVYRFDAGDFVNSYPWHDFQQGSASGDFVILNGFMYIAWHINGTDYLYKVTVDADFQYVSHEVLGSIPSNTYGLASELGQLYGVTPSYLYRLDEETLQTEIIIQNPSSSSNVRWWGASGLHEAQLFDVALYASVEDAQTTSNEIVGNVSLDAPFPNLYIRTDDELNGTYTIYPVEFIPFEFPESTLQETYQFCEGGEVEISVDYNLSDYSLLWKKDNQIISQNTQTLPISEPGNYSLQVTYLALNCVQEYDFMVATVANPLSSDEFILKCPEDEINLYIDNTFPNILWNTGDTDSQITVDEPGDYMVTVETQEGCLFSKSFTVENIEINPQIIVGLNSIQIIAETNDAPVLYSIDGGETWSSQFLFEGLETGEYVVKVQSNSGCMSEAYEVLIQFLSNTITPNGDGINDVWELSDRFELMPGTSFQICNKYGKMIYEATEASTVSWNGTYLGRKVASDTYWYSFQLSDGSMQVGYIMVKSY